MSATITGKLNKDANQFKAGDSTGFSVRLGVKYKDPKTKENDYCNYNAVIFAKSPGQIEFYQNALVEGSVIEVSAEQLKVDSYDGQNGQVLTIDMLNARLGYVHTAQGAPQSKPQQQPAQQGGFAPKQQHGGFKPKEQLPPDKIIAQAIHNNDVAWVQKEWSGLISHNWGSLPSNLQQSLNEMYNGI